MTKRVITIIMSLYTRSVDCGVTPIFFLFTAVDLTHLIRLRFALQAGFTLWISILVVLPCKQVEDSLTLGFCLVPSSCHAFSPEDPLSILVLKSTFHWLILTSVYTLSLKKEWHKSGGLHSCMVSRYLEDKIRSYDTWLDTDKIFWIRSFFTVTVSV